MVKFQRQKAYLGSIPASAIAALVALEDATILPKPAEPPPPPPVPEIPKWASGKFTPAGNRAERRAARQGHNKPFGKKRGL